MRNSVFSVGVKSIDAGVTKKAAIDVIAARCFVVKSYRY